MWTGTEFEINIAFIRHGKTESNEHRKYLSYTDESLSDEGKKQIEANCKGYPAAQKVYTSSLSRTIETAQIIYGDNIFAIKELDEINFGDFEGKTYEELQNNGDYISWLNSNCTCLIPNGEAREDFVKRQLSGLNKILIDARDYEEIAVVSHGGTVMSICSHFLGEDYYKYMIANGEYIETRVTYQVSEKLDVFISHFSIINRNDS